MAGAIAGTAILRVTGPSTDLHTVALTINNTCNLRCPHCYLQYDGEEGLIEARTVDAVFNAEFRHLAIVGKEPLVSKTSVDCVLELTRRARSAGRTTSVITNGLGLSRLPTTEVSLLSYIDVSFDGGPSTYESYRRGSLRMLRGGLEHVSDLTELNALHVLHRNNMAAIEDMMAVAAFAPFQRMVFSLYLDTKNHGANAVERAELTEVLARLSECDSFREARNALLLVDDLHLARYGVSSDEFLQLAEKLSILERVHLVAADPLLYGFIRVTYDGLVLAPHASVHPALYASTGRRIASVSLQEHFQSLTFQAAA